MSYLAFGWEPVISNSFVIAVPFALDTAADETLVQWCQTPITDLRTLDEFAADGGRPL